MMKKVKKLVALVGMLCCICLCGCMSNREKASTHTQKLLEKKYGEKFEVLNMWGGGGWLYHVECYPTEDRSLLFKGSFSLENDWFYDEYDEVIFGKQIREIIQPNMEEIFPECCVFPAVVSGPSGITDRKEVTIENFVKATNNPDIRFYIGINLGELKGDYHNEYQKITEYMKEIEDKGIGVTVELRFYPQNEYKIFVKESKENANIIANFQRIIEKGKEVSFGFKEGALNITEEEYSEEREGIQKMLLGL